MGKKGKGNKLAKMSEEERARYLQLRADIEEEARRRKMQLISMFMKAGFFVFLKDYTGREYIFFIIYRINSNAKKLSVA